MATEYFVCTGKDPQQLTANVNTAIKNGWEPTGGIAVLVVPPSMTGEIVWPLFLQAVTR